VCARFETVLTEKGYVDPAALDVLIETYETKVGPRNGARVVARAWADPDFRARLIEDATPAIAELGYAGRQGEHIVAVENTAQLHNMVVCTLCSCYPWPVARAAAGLVQIRALSFQGGGRIRAACSPISGSSCPRAPKSGSGISTAEFVIWCCRCVPPARWLERDAACRTRYPRQYDRHRLAEAAARDRLMEGAHDMAAWPGPGRYRPRSERAGVSRRMGAARICHHAGDGNARRLNIDMSRFAREDRPPASISA